MIRSSLPSMNATNLTFVGAGWEFDAYLTTDGWVVRFPRRQEMAGLFEKDSRVHPGDGVGAREWLKRTCVTGALF